MKKALKNIDLESTNRIIEMAWEDRTPFEVIEKEFSEKIETFGTAISKKTKTFKIKKDDLLNDLKILLIIHLPNAKRAYYL